VQVSQFETVVIENHPRFCNDRCIRFREMTTARLEVAIGLETAHEGVLERLNKQMTLADFERAVRFLKRRDISVRAFILLRPPYLSEGEGIEWADKSIQFAFSVGVDCCVIIPTRGGNGIMERLRERGEFSPPTLASMETALELGIGLVHRPVLNDSVGAMATALRGHVFNRMPTQSGGHGTHQPSAVGSPGSHRRVFVDLWDAERFATCPKCAPARIERLRTMNLTQRMAPPVACTCENGA
jgi:radical SAM enzyme (TIGR01210 family)